MTTNGAPERSRSARPHRVLIAIVVAFAVVIVAAALFKSLHDKSPSPKSASSFASKQVAPTVSPDYCTQPSPSPTPTPASAKAPQVPKKTAESQNAGLLLPDEGVETHASHLAADWGPPRPIFTLCRPSDFATIDSINDPSKDFDERSFLDIAPIAAGTHIAKSKSFSHNQVIKPNGLYQGSVYFWNDVADNVPDGGQKPAIARNTTVQLTLPTQVQNEAFVSASINSSTSVPKSIWSNSVLKTKSTSGPLAITIVPGSAFVETGGNVNTYSIDTNALTSTNGALIGCAAADGNLTGDAGCEGDLYFTFRATRPTFHISTTFAATETSNVDVNAGDSTGVQVVMSNNGTVALDSYSFVESLDASLRPVAGSVVMYFNDPNSGVSSAPVTFSNGEPTGTFNVDGRNHPIPPGGNSELDFRVSVGADQCKGAWDPIESDSTGGGVTIRSQIIVNVLATC